MSKKISIALVCVVVIASLTILYILQFAGNRNTPDSSIKVIVIQPYGDFPARLVKLAEEGIKQKYNLVVKILPNTPLMQSAWYSARQRYVADSLLLDLKRRLPQGAYKIIGLTSKDISTQKEEIKNYGVMGLGFLGGKSCVVSTFRLHKNSASEKLFVERFIKVILHEIGHTLGLDHCPTAKCIMQDCKGTMKTIDTESPDLCTNCQNKVSVYRVGR